MTESQWIVQQLQERASPGSSGVADELTRQVHRVSRHVEGLPDSATVRGIRSASAQFLLLKGGIEVALSSGGWFSNYSLSSLSRGFEYLGLEESLVVKAQLALSGAKNLEGKYSAPRLSVVYFHTGKDELDLLIDCVFSLPTEEFKIGGNLRAFAEVVFATFLMHFQEFYEDYGTSNLIVKTVTMKLLRFDLSLSTVFQLGKLIKEDYTLRNVGLTVDTKQPIPHIVENLAVQLSDVKVDLKVVFIVYMPYQIHTLCIPHLVYIPYSYPI